METAAPQESPHFMVRHGAILIYNASQLITLGLVIAAQAWSVLPALGFVIAFNVTYLIARVPFSARAIQPQGGRDVSARQ